MVNLQSPYLRKAIFALGLLFFALTALFNLGIIAIDDYAFVISQTIPAQLNSSEAILSNTGLWHPILPFLLHSLSAVGWRLGISEPYHQLQFVLVIFSILNYLVLGSLATKFFEEARSKTVSLLLISFFFVAPLLMTRPMIEAACAPLLFLSAFLGMRYTQTNSRSYIWGSVLTLSIASLIRYQSGICVLAWFFLVGKRRSLSDLGHLSMAMVCGFLLTGALDFLLTGQFHGSIHGYLNYNLYHSAANHGTQPFYVFILLFLALTLPPTFISKFAGFRWRERYQKLLAPLSYFAVFVFFHTLAGHKEERFMIPVLPLFLVCLTPLLVYFWETPGNAWRIRFFASLNVFLLFLTSFSTPQKNILGLIRFLDKTHHIQRVYSWHDTLVLFPTAFTTRQIDHVEVRDTDSPSVQNLSCNEIVAFREAYKEDLKVDFSRLTHLASFEPGPLEALIVKLNPKRNARRGTIEVFGKKGCE